MYHFPYYLIPKNELPNSIFNLLSDLFCHEVCYNLHEFTAFGHLKPGLNLILDYISNSVKNMKYRNYMITRLSIHSFKKSKWFQKLRAVIEVKLAC